MSPFSPLRVSLQQRILSAAEHFLLQLEEAEEAARVPALRAMLTERLTAEIVAVLEETVAEWEERVERSQREVCRQRRLLEAVMKPEVRLHRAVCRADVQQLVLSRAEVPSEQWSPLVDQEDPPHIKEEQEEPWTNQEGEQLEEADIKFTLNPVAVKSEEDEETPQSSQLHQSQTEENRANGGGPEPESEPEPEPGPGPGPGPARNSGPEGHLQPGPETEDSSGFNDSGCKKSFSCSRCGKLFGRKEHLQTHVRIHTGERPFVCSQCGKAFGCKRSLLGHMTSHTGAKPFGCSRCGKRFGRSVNLKTHERLHTGERPFTCPFCGRGFTQKVHMTQHMSVHTGDKQFSCSVCGRKFRWLSGSRRHKCTGPQRASWDG